MVMSNSTLPATTESGDLPSAVVATLLVLISATLEVCGAVLRKRAHNYGVLARALWRAWSVQTSANDEDFLDLEIWSPQYWLGFAMFIASRVALLVAVEQCSAFFVLPLCFSAVRSGDHLDAAFSSRAAARSPSGVHRR